MADESSWPVANRRQFLTTTGGLVAATIASGDALAALSPVDSSAPPAPGSLPVQTATTRPRRKLLIGVFDPVFDQLTLDQMIDKISEYGLEAVEIGTGGYPGAKHCPVDELLADPAKARAWKKKFEDRNIHVATLSCHGNPVHPDPARAAQ